jgi:hypothetical protein
MADVQVLIMCSTPFGITFRIAVKQFFNRAY